MMALQTVTADLLVRTCRALGGRPPSGQELLVTYVRVPDLPGTDPRASVLRPTHAWRLPVHASFGAGRAPTGVDAALTLVEDDGHADDAVPRLAVRLTYAEPTWWITNHASGSATVLITAPGARDELGARGTGYAVRRRRVTLTVPARSVQADGPVAVEHRLTLFAPWIPDDVPPVFGGPAGGADPASPALTLGRTVEPTRTMHWTWAQQRLLAAWAYPELLGLPPRTQPRERLTRLLLRQLMTGKDPNERILSRLRRKASEELGVPLAGEVNTPAFLAYLVARRRYLGEALTALHAEYDAGAPVPAAGVTSLRG